VVRGGRGVALGLCVTADILERFDPHTLLYLDWQRKWLDTARPAQIVPDSDWTEIGYMAGRGFGKGLALDTPVPTLSGWTTMGALRDGDELFDESGRVCRVVKAHDPYQPVDMFRITFADGSQIDADGDHLWYTLTHADRKQMLRHGVTRVPSEWPAFRISLRDAWGNITGERGAEVRDTRTIAATQTHSARGDRNHCIPVAAPLALPEADLPIDPWLLGYWLGNGETRGGTIYAGSYGGLFDDEHVIARQPTARIKRLGDKGHSIVAVPGLTAALRKLGLPGNKHIPAVYLRASEAQRLDLLRGLMDSDGHAEAKVVEFCSTRRVLADGVFELAASLGERPVLAEDRARLNGRDCGPRYRVTWRGARHNPFSLPRKRDRLQPLGKQARRHDHRMIVSVEPIEARTVRCITVDSLHATYLVGRALIPTHNTRVGAEWLGRAVFEDPTGHASCVIAPTYQDVKFTCFEGESGLLSVIPPDLIIHYNKSDLVITMRNCAGGESQIRGFTAEKPDRLRGPQHCRGWYDELAAWPYADEVWAMSEFGMRLGARPQVLWTTTPKPREIIRKLTTPKDGRVIVRGSTYDNKANLPKSFFDNLEQYEGTVLGRQELHGELIDPEESGIVKRSDFRLWPASRSLPKLEFIVMSLDTAFTEATLDKRTGDADPTACVVLGSFSDREGGRHLIVLDFWQEHLGFPDLVKRVKREMNTAYGDDQDTALIKPLIGSSKPLGSGRKPDLLLIEDKGSGISLRQTLEREGLIAYAYNPGRADKLTRLHMVSHIFHRKRIWLPESAKFTGQPRTWVEPMLAQLCAFTGPGSTKHDDAVDAMTQAVRLMMDKQLVTVLKTPPKSATAPQPPASRAVNPYAA
jgi:predicted phage terminase large subunit-like protein